jgi:DNA processing protein
VLAVLRPILGHGFREPSDGTGRPPLLAESPPDRERDRVRAIVEEKLGPAPVEVDELIRQCRASPAAVLTVLLELELAGRAKAAPWKSRRRALAHIGGFLYRTDLSSGFHSP